MRKKTAAAVLAATITIGGGAALVSPGLASAATSTGTAAEAASRLGAIKDALKSLVSDGTLTQVQSDKVASTLASSGLPFGRHGGPGGPGAALSPETVAQLLGITPQALRTAHDSGKTLTQIAASKGITRADLISKLVAAAKSQLSADLKAGRLTQAEYDRMAADLSSRISRRVDEVGRPGDHGGPGDHDGDGPGDGDGDGPAGAQPAAPGTASPAPTASANS
jgi:hypothetical protein